MKKYEHLTSALRFEEKTFALKRSAVLQGLSAESEKILADLGDQGWELVSVLPYTVRRREGTDGAIAFFKRDKV